ncbi:hypothetical protein DFP72DRAFT_846401 [Ephemerocybe angulata]|uniref:Uncharacterized protein n=1 Tax=Ephemerocybe angulata TaxID=980116 RepID=A0A8H6I1H8_9AGAR|nr:hypothetical protein DFP72DRAFT_846401 [Tulosesus angulatus]
MRLTVLALPLAFLSLVTAHGGAHAHNHPRDVDDLSARDILEDISTRELLDELSSRLDRRGGNRRGGKAPGFVPNLPYTCTYCRTEISSGTAQRRYPHRQKSSLSGIPRAERNARPNERGMSKVPIAQPQMKATQPTGQSPKRTGERREDTPEMRFATHDSRLTTHII